MGSSPILRPSKNLFNMIFESILFNLFYFFIVTSAFCVIFSENPVYSALFLILTFCNVIFLLLLMGAEFIAFLLLIVYVGAIAVLFLFVVMMLNIKKSSYNFNKYLIYCSPLLLTIIIILTDYFWNFYVFFDALRDLKQYIMFSNWLEEIFITSNIETIGNILYTDYCLLFIIAGCILLVAMIGVIVLTVHQKNIFLAKKQNINFQLTRNSKEIIKFVDIRKS